MRRFDHLDHHLVGNVLAVAVIPGIADFPDDDEPSILICRQRNTEAKRVAIVFAGYTDVPSRTIAGRFRTANGATSVRETKKKKTKKNHTGYRIQDPASSAMGTNDDGEARARAHSDGLRSTISRETAAIISRQFN